MGNLFRSRYESHESLLAYFPANEGTGTVLSDLGLSSSDSTLEGGADWAAGRFLQAVNLDGINDYVSINTDGLLNNLHKRSYSISFWMKPTDPSPGKYTSGQLRIRGYRVSMSDSYFIICPLFSICLLPGMLY